AGLCDQHRPHVPRFRALTLPHAQVHSSGLVKREIVGGGGSDGGGASPFARPIRAFTSAMTASNDPRAMRPPVKTAYACAAAVATSAHA
ncbi:hypothetical protein C1X93_30760, partial [Pseudomonas sp. GW456-11-11-14-LB1]